MCVPTEVAHREPAPIVIGEDTLFVVRGLVQVLGVIGQVPEDSITVDAGVELNLGHTFTINGVNSPFLLGETSGDAVQPVCKDVVVRDGYNIKLNYSGSTPVGLIEWTIWYRPLTRGAYVEVQ